MLNLREVVDRVYDPAGYEDYIYSGAPQPPLSDEESRWSGQVIRRQF
jgi:hypothetical protein